MKKKEKKKKRASPAVELGCEKKETCGKPNTTVEDGEGEKFEHSAGPRNRARGRKPTSKKGKQTRMGEM